MASCILSTNLTQIAEPHPNEVIMSGLLQSYFEDTLADTTPRF